MGSTDLSDLKDRSERIRLGRKVRAYFVHLFTASGVAFAFLAMREVVRVDLDPRWVFGWLTLAVLIDAADGPLARLWDVKLYASRILGKTIDLIVDYLTFTFIPLTLVWRMDWLPGWDGLWVTLAMVASLLGFANTAAKQSQEGFFLGFPSYWNVVAYYVGLLAVEYGAVGAYMSLGSVLTLTVLTLMPVRFVYPNAAPPPWRAIVTVGGVAWLGLLLALLPTFPELPAWGGDWVLGVSFVYPAFYFGLSGWLDWNS
ncbi:CDP-alcohol phosphatidyltransferase family protein [Salinibacter sp.]|uniref:CDP-alcohol phosphatidyltransferase family protein n=1 Tax=Salinibacter sp. TaxID=2065818 RepID=UPI0021E99B3A|nr:CDP-alcohol phosphatidyltransferase family protein [Salinibacter sp.]